MNLLGVTPFLILSLPRSRSAWMAHYLRYSGRVVGHDLATECASVAEFKAKLSLCDGSVETGAVLGWRLIRAEMPEVRLVVVKRPWQEVGRSLVKFGLEPPWEDLEARATMLDMVAELPGVLALQAAELDSPAVCKILFEHCLELPFDWQWWSQYTQINIQVDMRRRLERLVANHSRLEEFKLEVSARSSALVGASPCLN